MKDKVFKYIFFVFSALILATMLWTSKDAGISGDEEVHYKHSEMVYQYFATFGDDKASLHTPVTHLQYYGQAFDNLVTVLIHWFSIENIYSFRHLMCSVAGWLVIFITGLFAVHLAGFSAGVVVLAIFAASPTFLGHAHNNLKDIPFALAYIASVFFIAKAVFQNGKIPKSTGILLVLSMALAFGTRPGGLLLIIYLLFFGVLVSTFEYFNTTKAHRQFPKKKLMWIFAMAIAGYFLGLLLWPYALQNPVVNPWKSYLVMTQFPTTIRQIFEGSSIWSDLLPWYYLPKTMFITIPLVVWAGILLFAALSFRVINKKSLLLYGFILFTVLFPPIYAVVKDANLYGSWRHFLFIYPGIVLLAALGIHALIKFKVTWLRWAAVSAFIIMLIHPVKFMVKNHPYYYLYYNQSVGGLQNAYGDYETDYYYHSVREATEWLIAHLKSEGIEESVIGSNFSVKWFIRNEPGLSFRYFTWDNRNSTDWDYAVVCNSYITPQQLKSGMWPPQNAIHLVKADGVPVCAVLKRISKEDMRGIQMVQTNAGEAVKILRNAARLDSLNEVILYNLAVAYKKTGELQASDSVLHRSLRVHPHYELSMLMLGRNAEEQRDFSAAADFYERIIAVNPKYYRAYVLRAKLYSNRETEKARNLLKACLRLHSRYKPAIEALADTYRESEPEKAEKYDKLVKSIH